MKFGVYSFTLHTLSPEPTAAWIHPSVRSGGSLSFNRNETGKVDTKFAYVTVTRFSFT